MAFANYEVRDYQEKLFEVCCKRNSIIYLPTGSGKTFIALKVINHFRDVLKKPLNEGGKRAIFLVNTVCLANQHAQTIEDILELEVACWTSETKKKSWNREKFREEFEKYQVIVATAQLFVDAVKHSFIHIKELAVMVIDECHHAHSDHPYHELMKQFKFVDSTQHPRIIGLSGMLVGISSKISVDNIEDEIKSLEATLMSKILTVQKIQEYRNVLLFSTNPTENFVRYESKNDNKNDLAVELVARIGEIRWELSLVKIEGMQEINPKSLNPAKSRKLKALSLFFEEVKTEVESLGLFAAYLGLNSIKVQFGLIRKKAGQKREFLQQVDRCLAYTNELLKMLDELKFNSNLTIEKIAVNSTSKVRKLIALLMNKFNDPTSEKDLQCLIFVTQRSTAKCLYHLLKKYSEVDSNFPIVPDFVVGNNAELPESIDEVESSNENKIALQKFRKKLTNVIVTTSVLEEGIDLQMCNLVISFDKPTVFRSYIQSKGRARVRNSNYIVFLDESSVDSFMSKKDDYDEIDKKMKQILLTRACDGEISQEDIDNEQAEVWEPYITPEKALVNNLSSVALLNRFVSPYANINKMWKKVEAGGGKKIAIVTLPSHFGIGSIASDPHSDTKLAKQHAAFKACELLHQKGFLDNNLLPKA